MMGSRSTDDLRQNVALAQDLDILSFDLDVGPAVLAEQNLVADLDADPASLAAVQEAAGADRFHLPTLRLLLSGIRQNNSTRRRRLGAQRFDNNPVIQWFQLHADLLLDRFCQICLKIPES